MASVLRCNGRMGKSVKIWSSSSILKLNRQLRRIISREKILSSDVENKEEVTREIVCSLGNVNIIKPLNRVKMGNKGSQNTFILSYHVAISDILYHVKSRVDLRDDFSTSPTFYSLGNASLSLLRTLSLKSFQKIVYDNGIGLIFNFHKYFGIDLKNVYDIQHLLTLYSSVDSQLSPEEYGVLIRKHLYGEGKEDSGKINNSKEGEKAQSSISSENDPYQSSLDRQLYFKPNSLESLFPLKRIYLLRNYLKWRYKINNETFNLKMETLYNDIKVKPRVYIRVYTRELEPGRLSPKLLGNKFLSDIFEKEFPINLVTDPGPFYGIVTNKIENEQKVILNINSFLVDEIKKEVVPLYGVADEKSFKYFSDKKIGDVAECVEWESENFKVQFREDKAFIEVKRLYQESLIYSLRNRRYVPINQIIVEK